MCLLIGPTTQPPTTPTTPSTSTNVGNDARSSSDAAVIGTVVGVCVLVLLVFCTVVILLLILFLNNRRIQAQQQWQKDPEFQVNNTVIIMAILLVFCFNSLVTTISECWIDESTTHSFQRIDATNCPSVCDAIP